MDLVITIAGVGLLFAAAFALSSRRVQFMDRAVGFATWRGDPWPAGVQEEDLDHAWGQGAEMDVTQARNKPDKPTIDDLPADRATDGLPETARVRTTMRRLP